MKSVSAHHNLRWLIRRDMPEVLGIEADYRCGLSEQAIKGQLKQRNAIGIVAEAADGPIDGYCIYTLHPDSFRIERLAVHKMAVRSGIGRKMVERLQERLTFAGGKRFAIEVDVPERNLPAQLFFAACGLRAIGCFGGWIAFRYESE